MPLQTAQVGDVGTAVIITITSDGEPLNVSTAVVKQVIFGYPDGSGVAFTASFVTDGVDGQIQYVTASDEDFAQAGDYQVQGRIQLPTGEWHTVKGHFTVLPNIAVTV